MKSMNVIRFVTECLWRIYIESDLESTWKFKKKIRIHISATLEYCKRVLRDMLQVLMVILDLSSLPS